MQQGLLLTLLLHSLFSDAVSFILLLPSKTCPCCCILVNPISHLLP